MLKANELRLGNLIKVSCPNSYLIQSKERTVEKCNIHHLEDIANENVKWMYEPIELTEEWLLNFGFVKDEEIGYRWCLEWEKCIIIAYDLDDKCIRVSDTWEFGKRDFVHQLQNLYFSLTGVELELSSNVA
ncbi:hypothetical protein UFOVP105_2 [uncultured Caudovirales phage]|uniref:Uncharacterized protein n=1 Tax=uncultured Caudovirales phage TaxID=2100421 RepID=A0A6J5L3U1_9CAUD|nr:hypothetical protein UFOVP105_2 [uncultured Caudovirales phage]